MLYRIALRAWLVSALSLALVAVASSAFADAKTEGAAKQLESKAMQEDYLATDFDKALEKLNQAASKCGTEKCSSLVRAQIKRDIGVCQIGKQNRDAGIAAFTDALRIDSGVQLDPDTRTKDVDAAWAEAKKQSASGGGGGGGGAGGGAGGPPPAGDFTVQPAAETLVRTPLDVFGDYTGNETLAKVVLKYKGFGMGEWKTLEMKEMGKGWGVEIPCLDVTQGELLYYLQGFNAANDPVATSGDRNNPYKVAVKRDFAGEVPHFPGKDAPKQCQDTGDCPPDFPGCKKPAAGEETPESTLKSEGQDCEEDSECQSGSCGKDKTCKGGGGGKSKWRKFWIGIEGDYDFVSIPSGTQVCLLSQSAVPVANANGYYCTMGGQDFPSRSDNGAQDLTINKAASDKVSGGFAPGNFRVKLSFDYAATAHLLIGVRLGYVLNAYNGQAASNEGKAFAPIDAEARATYVFGDDPFAKAGLGIYGMLAGGVTQYSAQVGVTVVTQATNGQPVNNSVQAWNMGGPGFIAVGGGIRYAFTPRVALLLGPRLTAAFGGSGLVPVISPELGLQYGF